jgi:hypothetical protein
MKLTKDTNIGFCCVFYKNNIINLKNSNKIFYCM